MIRRLSPEDVPAIAAIYNGYVTGSVITFETDPVGVEEMRARIARISATYPCWVYEEAGRVVGYCYAHAWKEKAAYRATWETTIYLDPGWLGRGIGRALMERLIEDCRECGAHALIACITEGNEGSVTLHERLGFRQVSRFSQVGVKFGRWLDVVDYELIL